MRSGKQWISISDLMAGLMMIFMFIAIVFMLKTEKEQERSRELALTYQEYQQDLYKSLYEEFEDDLQKWGAELLLDNTIRFNEPEILFARSSSEINENFALILSDFYPRYIRILYSDQYRENIDEIRIEGHTSSDWIGGGTMADSYLGNAALSQARSLSVLNYVFQLDSVSSYRDWMTTYIRANGLSFAKRILLPDGSEDLVRSRRVEFRVETKAEERIYKILETLDGN
ncbi:MAG: OmpA family protein [Pseudohongiellaceae bacterium]|nr:OmpA family protein [Pseudohongiellaceae bacterium]